MTTVISGDTGVSQVQAGSINQDDLAANVVGKGALFAASGVGSVPLSSNVYGKITNLTNEVYDTNNWYSGSRFTPQVAGWYQISGSLEGTASAGFALAEAHIFKNGAIFGPIGTLTYIATGYNSAISSVSCLVYLNGSTDYVELYGRVVGSSNPGAAANNYFEGFLARAA